MQGTLTLPSNPYFPSFHQSNRRNVSVRAAAAAEVADRRSLYEVLRIQQSASQGEIKTAYRTLAKLYHPDATSRFMDSSIASCSDGRDFIQIQNAYATLSDPNARAVYDLKLNVDSKSRWEGIGVPDRRRAYPTRKWETDQCW